jgi:formate/nitrite transporter FocA (FNT family)
MADEDQDGHAPLEVLPLAQIAHLVEEVGILKVALGVVPTLTLGILAGAFIAFGAMLYTVAITGSELGYGPTRLLGAAAFSTGLILVVVGRAELFTGNNLIAMAWADGRVSTRALAQLGAGLCGQLHRRIRHRRDGASVRCDGRERRGGRGDRSGHC